MPSATPLFPDPESEPPPQAARLRPRLRALASQGIYLGTSSWKYEGWLGSIYSPERYLTRGKFSRAKFESECLAEYARAFPIVGGDFSFYQFPTPEYWRRLFGEAPDGLRFGFKVPEEVTVATWPRHARYGARAGLANRSFLDAERFTREFAGPLERYRERVATVMFEFGQLPRGTITAADFRQRLGAFLAALPGGFRYGVEIRNPEYLQADYFAVLADQNVAHVMNAWTRMPDLGSQARMPGVMTADFVVVRALLRRGRTYEAAVKSFEPYRETQDPDPATRAAMAVIADQARRAGRPAFLFVNNRLEGNAPATIEAVIHELELLENAPGVGARAPADSAGGPRP